MSSPIEHELIERVHASGMHILLSITGGGSRAIASLLEVPGASSSIVGAIVPYAPTALESWLGGAVDQHCSERTSRAMAMTAFGRARQFCDADPRTLRGIGATASLASTRPKRGPHRIHVAWQSAEATVSYSCELVKGERTRAEEEMVATQLILTAVCEACGVDGSSLVEPSVAASVRRREQHAPAAWTQLLLGERTSVAIHDEDSPVLFPGAFNPLHEGHLQMAEVARAHYSMPVTFELSITNVDKAPLDFIELADRLKPLADRSVLLTRADIRRKGQGCARLRVCGWNGHAHSNCRSALLWRRCITARRHDRNNCESRLPVPCFRPDGRRAVCAAFGRRTANRASRAMRRRA